MNYLNIERARQKYNGYLEDLQKLESQINLSLLILGQTSPSPLKRSQAWQVLKQKGENLRNEIEQELHKLEEIHFSVESESLKVEKTRLISQYDNLIEALGKKESIIAEQMDKKKVPVVPFRQETPEVGRCYYCRVDITNSFSYQIEKEVQEVSNIKIVAGARFCSQNCLFKYCEKIPKVKWSSASRTKKTSKKNHG